ncbi:hypothetical protein [Dyella koreensis]|uniref:RHS repeat protein n=1 Tax=Dyella koreensis TaxID=311235 RepID=A0ABW8KC24_9GAMM
MTRQEYGSGGQQLRDYDAAGNLIHANGPWNESLAIDPASNRAAGMGLTPMDYDARLGDAVRRLRDNQ